MNQTKVQIYIGKNISIPLFVGIVFAGLIFLGLMYGYLIQATVRNAVALDQYEKKLTSLSSSLGELESDYMALSGRITPDLARELGFQVIEASKFITRPTVGGKLSLNNEI